jgi:hypothetical protein
MAFPTVPALLTSYVSVVIGPNGMVAALRNRFSLSIYVTDMTINMPACRAVARGNKARLRPSGYGAAAFPRVASEGWEGLS